MTSEQQETAGSHLVYHPPSSTDVEYWGPGVCLRFLATGKDTNGAYTQVEHVVAPGGGPPAHLHQREDETWYVVEGRVEFRIGDVTLLAQPGDYLRGPRGTAHVFQNVGERTARVLITFVPAGIEHFFMEVFQPVGDRATPPPAPPAELIARMIQAAPRYGLEFFAMLPPPESGAAIGPGFDAHAPTGPPDLQH
jgi:quercetin dioxygenase-like cupin family protein